MGTHVVSEEVVVAWSNGSRAPATAARSTLIASSLRSLRERNHYERYLGLLPREHHDAIVGTLAPTWIPMDHAIAHYRACDSLELSNDELVKIGNEVGERIQGTFMATLARRATSLGVTPWLPIGQFQRLWDRMFQGGGVAVYKLGPRNARLEVRGMPLAEIEYFRRAFAGVIEGTIGIFCSKANARLITELCRGSSLGIAASWT
jgi:hypothetical protein